jgi:hypothetical protein
MYLARHRQRNIFCADCDGWEVFMKRTFSYIFAWLAAAGVAFGLAFASPNEASVMGRLPVLMAKTLNRKPVMIPEGLVADRTLALITFQKGQRPQIDSWINGLNLKGDASISWLRMPVIEDPGNLSARAATENKLLLHYTGESDRAKLVPVFTDRASFIRSAGLNGTDQAYAVVINRNGDVLARAEGEFDETKAAALRETLHESSKF